MNIKALIKPFVFTRTMRSITRITLDRELRRQFSRLKPGLVLDVGSKLSPYKTQIPFTTYLRLDIDPESKPDICSDIHHLQWTSNFFDTVVLTETLEHLYDPRKAMQEVHRVLKPGGICIASTRFVYPYHPDPKDYYRFTWDSLKFLFESFGTVEIHTHGNGMHAIWQMICIGKVRLILNIFNPLLALIPAKQTMCPLGFVVYGIK